MFKLLMRRLMKELTHEVKNDIRFQIAAANALQEASEIMLIN
jgi:histone H3/H4